MTCRTCKWAEWQRTPNGRRKFGSAGQCNYPVSPLPKSMRDYYGNLPKKTYIYGLNNFGCDCPVYEKGGK